MRFTPKSSPGQAIIGEPVDADLDVGKALYQGQNVAVAVFSGTSILAPGEQTNHVETVDRLLSPLSKDEVGTIRCIGLNVWLPTVIHDTHVSY